MKKFFQRKVNLSLRDQIAVFVVAGALIPLAMLIALGSVFFTGSSEDSVPFSYWIFLVLAWGLGSAALIARMLANGLIDRLKPLANAAEVLSQSANAQPGKHKVVLDGADAHEFEQLMSQFNNIEDALAQSRAAALSRIVQLDREVEHLRAAARTNASFLSAVSHEIRTPLSAIVSSARIIQHYHTKKPEVVERFGETICTEGKRLVQLVGDLLDMAKMEAATLEWQEGEFRVERILADAIERRASAIADRDIELHVDVKGTLPAVWG